MRTTNAMMSLLLVSAVFISPASANWFSNPAAGTNLNIGSAPNPTPADLRAIGDSAYARAPSQNTFAATTTYVAPEQTAYTVVQPAPRMRAASDLGKMEGRMLYGSHGERLGSILAVDRGARMIDVQTPGGVAVAMKASLVTEKGGRLMAPSISHREMMAMAKKQTGHTVALNVDLRHRESRG